MSKAYKLLPSAILLSFSLNAFAVEAQVEIKRFPAVISASTDFNLIPKELQISKFTVTVLSNGKSKLLKNLTFTIVPDVFAPYSSKKKGTFIKGTSANEWIYTAPKELKSEKHPAVMKIKIFPKCFGKPCGNPSTITVRPVFKHLLSMHTDSPEDEFREPSEADYNLAWQYVRWKYEIDTSNLDEIKFNPDLKYKGVTYAGIFNNKRYCELGKTAFVNENVVAGVLGHENVHGGQKLLWYFGFREKAEPPAYNWEVENAARLGLSPEYVRELKHWRNSYSEKNRGSKIRIFK